MQGKDREAQDSDEARRGRVSFDASKAIFYFTSENRVDFRELVKDLAAHFYTRIEMRQIGVRDEAKMVGGIGPCGREFCCSSFLVDFRARNRQDGQGAKRRS